MWKCEATVWQWAFMLERGVSESGCGGETEWCLAFRSRTEIIWRSDNGNFLGTLEVISKSDPFLKAQMEKFGNAGMGSPL